MADGTYWIEERPRFYVQTGAMHENPYGVPRSEIERYIANNPPEVVAQVVFGKYVESSGLVFTAELINQLFDRSFDRVMDEGWIDQERWRQGRIDQLTKLDLNRYATGVDLARKKDHTVITVIDTYGATPEQPARVVYWKRLNRVPWPSIYAEIGKALYLFPGLLLVDATGSGGDIVMEELENRLYCHHHHASFASDHRCPHKSGCTRDDWIRLDPEGYVFGSQSKVQLINHLQSILGRGYDQDDPDKPFGILRCPPIYQLEEELAIYAWDDKKLATDCVFSLALAAWAGLEDVPLPLLAESIYGV